MKIVSTDIEDVKIIEPEVFGDHRGFFMESWSEKKLRESGLDLKFVQDNHSKSSTNILRGLHYQVVKPQGKLVRVVRGAVFDVAVDIRRSSPTFGKWVGVELNEDNKKMLWIPPGFAHGFYVLGEEAEFLYKCTEYYMPEHDRTLRWDDPEIAIDWPLQGDTPVLSDKDSKGPFLSEAELFD